MMAEAPLDPTTSYVFLRDGGRAAIVAGGEPFWRNIMSGSPTSPDARLVADGDGWLTLVFRIERNTPTWEMHPAGDELLVLLSGAVDVVLEDVNGTRVVALRAGTSCVVPRGVWHKQVVRTPGDELAITYGKGTAHRPV